MESCCLQKSTQTYLYASSFRRMAAVLRNGSVTALPQARYVRDLRRVGYIASYVSFFVRRDPFLSSIESTIASNAGLAGVRSKCVLRHLMVLGATAPWIRYPVGHKFMEDFVTFRHSEVMTLVESYLRNPSDTETFCDDGTDPEYKLSTG